MTQIRSKYVTKIEQVAALSAEQKHQLKPVTDTNPPYLGFIKKLSQFSHSPTVTLCHLSTA